MKKIFLIFIVFIIIFLPTYYVFAEPNADEEETENTESNEEEKTENVDNNEEEETSETDEESESSDSASRVEIEIGTPRVKEKFGEDSENENFVTLFNKDEYKSLRANVITGSGWLYEALRASEDTEEMVDIVKYLLFMATGYENFEIEMNWDELTDFSQFGTSYTNGTGFWWPIGSSETEEIDGKLFAKGDPATTNITSYFGEKEDFRITGHGAIDISNGKNDYIIAAADGKVISVVSDIKRNGWYRNYEDGGGFGNYVFIDHGNGVYIYYAHLAPNSVTVKAKDTVKQGQVIGKMGTTGSSTGIHLHFEVRKGGQTQAHKVDPLDYVDPENPRPTINLGSYGSLKNWFLSLEGGGKHITNKGWIVFDPEGNDNTMNLALGIVIADSNGAQSWYQDIIPGKVHVGDIVSEEKALRIWTEHKLKVFTQAIDSACTKYNVTLNSHQRDACISFIYRTGEGCANDLINSYATGGNKGLWNYMKTKYDKRPEYVIGTKNRVAEEYELFTKGDYTYTTSANTTPKYDKFCNNN